MGIRDYKVIPSARRTIAIQIMPDGQVLVRCPLGTPEQAVEGFVRQKTGWIKKHLKKAATDNPFEPFTDVQLRDFTDRTRQLLQQRLPMFARRLGVCYQRVCVRRQHTRWGSCSGKGNLNFNCLLALVPSEVFDYVVVHELCHLKEMNHSKEFWAEVEAVLPDYKICKEWLKDHGSSLIRRL